MSKPTTTELSGKSFEEAAALVSKLRKREWTDADVAADLEALREGSPAWRRELLLLLTQANGIPLQALYSAIGVGPAVVMARRRKDPVLESAIRDYLGAFFEDEAQMPIRDVKAGVLLSGLTNHAHGWKAEQQRILTDEDLHQIIRAIVDSIRLRVKDTEAQKDIGEDITAVLAKYLA